MKFVVSAHCDVKYRMLLIMLILKVDDTHVMQSRAGFTVSTDQLLNEDKSTVVDIQDQELNEQLALID